MTRVSEPASSFPPQAYWAWSSLVLNNGTEADGKQYCHTLIPQFKTKVRIMMKVELTRSPGRVINCRDCVH